MAALAEFEETRDSAELLGTLARAAAGWKARSPHAALLRAVDWLAETGRVPHGLTESLYRRVFDSDPGLLGSFAAFQAAVASGVASAWTAAWRDFWQSIMSLSVA